ncbi:MAG: DUF4440 domain-containing protein [Bryobacterales bacterium]
MARFVLAALLSCACLVGATPEEEIRAVLEAQTEAWNRGDIESFMTGYEDSPETTFVGKEVRKGYASVLARYRRNYPTRARMGETTFSDIGAWYDTDVAIVLGAIPPAPGRRSRAAMPPGVFSLVFAKTDQGWKILLDHTPAERLGDECGADQRRRQGLRLWRSKASLR